MIFPYPLLEAKFEKREKRFFAYAKDLSSNEELIAHCPNSGSMKGNQDPGSPVWFMDFGPEHPGRKLRYKWVMVESRGTKVVVDTLCANDLVWEAFQKGKISELAEYKEGTREKKINESSRIDFFFPGTIPAYVEVKSVSMGQGIRGSFPDAVTTRGQKHLRELMELKRSGNRAILFFLLVREGASEVEPCDAIDPEYGRLLREAVAAGVEVLVYGIHFLANGIELGSKGNLVLR